MVSRHKEEFGLNRCLVALGVSKGTWHYRQSRAARHAEVATEEQRLKQVILEVVEEHPAYGYRRLLPELEERGELTIRQQINYGLQYCDWSARGGVAQLASEHP